MKVVKNTSMQGIYVVFETPEGSLQRFLGSKSSIEVPDSWGGRVLDNLIVRRMVKVTNVQEPPVPIAPSVPAPKKKTKKSN
tara:strand:- start:3796 stop:4038 length:243 start_codon:yes stop_codon:yes gene_type:complete